MKVGHCLVAIIMSEHYKKNDWQQWADRQIIKNLCFDDWLYNLSISKNKDEACIALSDLLIDENYRNNDLELISDVVIGYYYLDYLKRNITICCLLKKSGLEADGGESRYDCEEFYELLNNIEDKNTFEIRNKIKNLFEPLGNIALKQKNFLENL